MTDTATVRASTTTDALEINNETWGDVLVAQVLPKSNLDFGVTEQSKINGENSQLDPMHALLITPRIPLPLRERPITGRRDFYRVLQDWEGVVEEVNGESFTARLRDKTASESYPVEVAELPVEDVSDDDRELLCPGAVFYLTIGRLVHASGRHDRVARIVFRRLPAWTESTLLRANLRAERLGGFLASSE